MNTLYINQTSANSTAPIFASISKAIANIPSPIQMLRAYGELSKFRKLDSAALQDMGLTQENLNQTTVVDFFYAPTPKR